MVLAHTFNLKCYYALTAMIFCLGSPIVLVAEKEIILSAGPINTPQILMNSGVGDRDSLARLNIKSVLHLPSVGKNLTDQPITTVLYSVNSNKPLDK